MSGHRTKWDHLFCSEKLTESGYWGILDENMGDFAHAYSRLSFTIRIAHATATATPTTAIVFVLAGPPRNIYTFCLRQLNATTAATSNPMHMPYSKRLVICVAADVATKYKRKILLLCYNVICEIYKYNNACICICNIIIVYIYYSFVLHLSSLL